MSYKKIFFAVLALDVIVTFITYPLLNLDFSSLIIVYMVAVWGACVMKVLASAYKTRRIGKVLRINVIMFPVVFIAYWYIYN